MPSDRSIAYVGLSSPIAYDYKCILNDTEYGYPEDEFYPIPNPIIESPLALMLLYDEIWFLHPFLCPKNMQNLEFVKFISDKTNTEKYFDEIKNDLRNDEFYVSIDVEYKQSSRSLKDRWREIVKSIAPFANYDYSGEVAFDLAPSNITSGTGWKPTPSYGDFAKDYYIINQLDTNVDYVSNSIVNDIIQYHPVVEGGETMTTVEDLVSKSMISYQKPEGPYFNKINEFRDLPTLSDFRQKMRADGAAASSEELNREFNKIRNEILISETENWNIYESIILFASNFVPGVSQITGPVSDGRELFQSIYKNEYYGWANFLAKVEESSED